MPQVHITLAPGVLDVLGLEILTEVGETLVKIIEQFFGIEGKKDGAFTAIEALATYNEAPIQVEVRSTVGKDEYKKGRPFDPSERDQEILAGKVLETIRNLTEDRFKASFWFKGYHKSVFKTQAI